MLDQWPNCRQLFSGRGVLVCALMVLLVKLFCPTLAQPGPITRLSDGLFGSSKSVGGVRLGSLHDIRRRSHDCGDSATVNYFDGHIRSAGTA